MRGSRRVARALSNTWGIAALPPQVQEGRLLEHGVVVDPRRQIESILVRSRLGRFEALHSPLSAILSRLFSRV
jgi:hypothetical protein